ncbi:hypothetical protein GCM10009678_77360 [Actinomadura kijaniata]|uniref:Uncharacterized protein n=1 Tax=Actinomadura namibiensis TaxID=182080 RepID=A0A7W3QLD8_ACTNM|nr:hypothetical protein [Actinomadura namibiensis]MBA8951464.1 hypothetical protein [Actinomadura namibiensis]
MTGLSDELLRSALRDAAATVRDEDLRPLPAAPPPRRPRLVPFGGLAAAVAVTVVALLVAAPWSRHPGLSLAAYTGVDYVLEGAWPPGAASVTVRKADTGRQVATVPAPAGSGGFRNSADSGDHRTFVLTTADPRACRVRFHRLVLGADGRPSGAPTELRGADLRQRMGEGPEQLAVSPGARRIAYAGRECDPSGRGTITVVDPATGEHRVTRLPPRALASSLRWAPNGRELVFETMGDYLEPGLHTLDTATGRVSPISLGGGDGRLHGAMFDKNGTHIVALVRNGGRNRVVWYAPASKTITREVPLPSSDPDAPTTFEVAGNRVVAMIGDRVHVVTGTKVTTGRADRLPG